MAQCLCNAIAVAGRAGCGIGHAARRQDYSGRGELAPIRAHPADLSVFRQNLPGAGAANLHPGIFQSGFQGLHHGGGLVAHRKDPIAPLSFGLTAVGFKKGYGILGCEAGEG